MTIEKQVVSLEIAKKLKELGVKQESYFYYFYQNTAHSSLPPQYEWTLHDDGFLTMQQDCIIRRLPPIYEDFISAFTAGELGEILKDHFSGTSWNEPLKKWICFYEGEHEFDEKATRILANMEADARGLMLIYLLEQKLMTREEG